MIANRKLLIIGLVWPEPATTAAGTRMLQLVRLFMKDGYTVIFATPATSNEHSYMFEDLNIETRAIEVNNDSFDVLLQHIDPDVVLFDRYITEEQFGWRVTENCPNALKILDTEDLHFLRHAREQSWKTNLAMEQVLKNSTVTMRELASIYRCDLSLLISDYEIKLLTEQFNIPENIVQYVPFLMSQADLLNDLPRYEERYGFMTIGNFKHKPNLNSVQLLKQSIWPLIRSQLPDSQIYIYGAYMPDSVLAMHDIANGFHVMGWAPEIETAFAKARICLAPLPYGAGLKGKLVDAMRFGTPSITNNVGSEGFYSDLPWGGYIASDDDSFATQAVRIYQDKMLWTNAQQNGFAQFEQLCLENSYGQEFLHRISKIRDQIESHRTDNIIGAMLQHHTMKSTAYMGKWITLKNKNAKN